MFKVSLKRNITMTCIYILNTENLIQQEQAVCSLTELKQERKLETEAQKDRDKPHRLEKKLTQFITIPLAS